MNDGLTRSERIALHAVATRAYKESAWPGPLVYQSLVDKALVERVGGRLVCTDAGRAVLRKLKWI